MKKLILISILTCLSPFVWAQQDAHYSQYMFNGQLLNPAYAGVQDRLVSTLTIREQWLGIQGRPGTQSLGMNGPSRNLRHGYGFILSNDRYGATQSTRLAAQYAFRMRFSENAQLALGLQGSVNSYRVDLEGLHSQDPSDPAIVANSVNRILPNAGAGIFFFNKWLYLGFSAPDLLENRLSNTSGFEDREDRNFFGTAGIAIKMGKHLSFRPSVMARYNPVLPPSLDLNGMLVISDKVWLGCSYRLQESLVPIFQVQLNQAWRIGYAYDYPMSVLKGNSSGSHELMLGFDFHFKHNESVSPRFFR